MLSDFRISELRTLFKYCSVTPSIFRQKIILDACTCARTLLVITQDSLPEMGVEDTSLKAKDTKKSKDSPLEAMDRIARGLGPRIQRGRVFKKNVFAQNLRKFSAKRQRSTKKKGLRPQIRKFSKKFKRQKFFFAISLARSKTKQHCS